MLWVNFQFKRAISIRHLHLLECKMKSPWLWIIGAIVAIWIFSGEKIGNSPATTTHNPPSQMYYQSQPTYQQPTTPAFMGYSCTEDCSGHEAGYKWAEENGIDDPDDCGGNSDSFIEGCQAYAEEQQESTDETTDDE
jgi:hypothetical protein